MTLKVIKRLAVILLTVCLSAFLFACTKEKSSGAMETSPEIETVIETTEEVTSKAYVKETTSKKKEEIETEAPTTAAPTTEAPTTTAPTTAAQATAASTTTAQATAAPTTAAPPTAAQATAAPTTAAPTTAAQATAAPTTAAPTEPPTTAYNINEADVYSAIMAFQSRYPTGTPWDNSNYYAWNGGIYCGGYGCAGFAFMLSDGAFGTLPARLVYSMDNVRIGDILRIYNDCHSVIVIGIDGDTFTIAEGNMNNAVYWGRQITKSEITDGFKYVMTRYPE